MHIADDRFTITYSNSEDDSTKTLSETTETINGVSALEILRMAERGQHIKFESHIISNFTGKAYSFCQIKERVFDYILQWRS